MSDHHEEEHGIKSLPSQNPAGKKAWNVFFILMYPVIMTFSLLFTGILLFFSGLSKVFSLLFSLIPTRASGREKPQATGVGTPTDIANEH